MHEVKERQKNHFHLKKIYQKDTGTEAETGEKDSQKQAKEEAKKIIQDGDKVGCEIQVW